MGGKCTSNSLSCTWCPSTLQRRRILVLVLTSTTDLQAHVAFFFSLVFISMLCALPLASTWWNSFPLWLRKHHYDIINAEISKWRLFQLWVNYVFFEKQLMVANNQRLLSRSGQAKHMQTHVARGAFQRCCEKCAGIKKLSKSSSSVARITGSEPERLIRQLRRVACGVCR